MNVTKSLQQAAAHAQRVPLIKFVGKRTIPAAVDHTPHAHPASPTQKLPESFTTATSFSAYRQQAQQHGPLGKSVAKDSIGWSSGKSLGPVTPAAGEYFDSSDLPARFHRQPYDQAEIDAIETGGATLVC